MEPREWIERTLQHEECEAVPYNFMFSPPAQRLAEQHYGTPIGDTIDLPIRMMGAKSIKPLYSNPAEFGDTVTDEYGVTWSTSEIDRGSPIGPCLAKPALEGYSFPDPTREYRFEDLAEWTEQHEGYYRVLWVGDLWERATFMRGMEDILLDLALNPSFVEELLSGIADFILQSMEILLERFEFESIAVSDDYGTQKAMVMSPQDWRRFVKPRLTEIYSLAKQNGRGVLHHTCGNNTEIIGDLIDIGLDILHPIQPEAMDLQYLKKEFGANLTFCGGLSTQGLLVTGTPDVVRAEVKRLKEEMGQGGGYILEPGITIQADVPLENMVAMIDEAREPAS